ncbi:MAG: hypothetical protein AVDCRST_MAG39-704 [uncultured Sphingomonadaceae bacterium]|uniref:Uncharacterized protein n=1 Tax=uncultured Sphingomonadaceae bacterium TaxID=169976 RepID=A0A6J4SBQ0_9SPHN|nr:MAG: hypothetical protein AVDCRST_MAG39-704 [uncultured Sphingomonadaceae bacterium]
MPPVALPSALMLFWPLNVLPWPATKLAWLLLNGLFTAGLLLLLAARRFLSGVSAAAYVAVGGLLLLGLPWRVALGNGQGTIAALFFFLLAAALADRGRGVFAGLALAASLASIRLLGHCCPSSCSAADGPRCWSSAACTPPRRSASPGTWASTRSP